ncbi:unnamed protein product [Ectocarpus fasciculatus]
MRTRGHTTTVTEMTTGHRGSEGGRGAVRSAEATTTAPKSLRRISSTCSSASRRGHADDRAGGECHRSTRGFIGRAEAAVGEGGGATGKRGRRG